MIDKITSFIKKSMSWLVHHLHHKIEHFTLKALKNLVIEGGIPLLVIVIGWEIIEDVAFPVLFALLGRWIHPIFYAGIPVAWVLCLHWLMVPLLWTLWLKYRKRYL